jgi:hypothetical protein
MDVDGAEPTGSVVRFDPDAIVDRDTQLLLAPEVFLRRLHAFAVYLALCHLSSWDTG